MNFYLTNFTFQDKEIQTLKHFAFKNVRSKLNKSTNNTSFSKSGNKTLLKYLFIHPQS